MSAEKECVAKRTKSVQKVESSEIRSDSRQARAGRTIRTRPSRRATNFFRIGRASRSGMISGIRRTTGILGTLGLLPFLMTVGCASGPNSSRQAADISAQGPGTVFFSIETAAYDALSYSYLLSRADRKPAHSMGGSIYSVAGGFSYTSPNRAEKFNPDEVNYPLRPEDVAHYHTYPRHWDRNVNLSRENFSKFDRRVVNSVDPLHRPSFILTPKLKVKVYRGNRDGTLFLAKLGEWNDVIELARSAPGPVPSAPNVDLVSSTSMRGPIESREALSGIEGESDASASGEW